MLYLICYDVSTKTNEGAKRLNIVAKTCCNYGQRVQNSLFECDLSGAQYVDVKNKLLSIMDVNTDSLRIYNLGNNYCSKIEQYGAKESYDPQGDLIL